MCRLILRPRDKIRCLLPTLKFVKETCAREGVRKTEPKEPIGGLLICNGHVAAREVGRRGGGGACCAD
jgi:hypothetical protein